MRSCFFFVRIHLNVAVLARLLQQRLAEDFTDEHCVTPAASADIPASESVIGRDILDRWKGKPGEDPVVGVAPG